MFRDVPKVVELNFFGKSEEEHVLIPVCYFIPLNDGKTFFADLLFFFNVVINKPKPFDNKDDMKNNIIRNTNGFFKLDLSIKNLQIHFPMERSSINTNRSFDRDHHDLYKFFPLKISSLKKFVQYKHVCLSSKHVTGNYMCHRIQLLILD